MFLAADALVPGLLQQQPNHNCEDHGKDYRYYKSIPLRQSLPSGRRKADEPLNPTVQEPNLRLHGMRFAAHERFFLAGELWERKPLPPLIRREFRIEIPGNPPQ